METCHIIKKELILFNLLTVFICSFLLMAPLFGYLGDRYNRKYIMIGGLCVWLVTAASSSLVTESVSDKWMCSHTLYRKQEATRCYFLLLVVSVSSSVI